MHVESPALDISPEGHAVHDDEPAVEVCPAEQTIQAVAPVFILKEPAAQSSASLLPVIGTNLPAGALKQEV